MAGNLKNKNDMKKIFVFALLSVITLAANATDLFTGNQHVTWGEGIQFEAAKFADAKAGDKIVINYADASDGIELKVMNENFDRLPGSLAWKGINGEGTVEQFLTSAAVAQLKQYGLEVIGANFNVTKVELTEGKDNVTENTAWTGYFWMDEWSTLEIVKTSFDGVNWANVKAIRFCSEANRTDYVINVMTDWAADAKIADQNTMTMTNEYAELNLDGIDMPAFLAKSDRLMIQCNKEGGDPFNFTSVELVMDASGINAVESTSTSVIYDITGRKASSDAKGILIVNGKKYIK